MSAISSELEHELAHELAHESSHESASEAAHEQEGEHEAFFNHLAAMADRSGRSQALRKIALAAARAALRGQKPYGPGIEGEHEAQGASELEASIRGSSPAQIDAIMEHMGHAAAEAESEQEAAEHFLPLIPFAAKALLPIAGKLIGKAATKFGPKIISRVTPMLTRGVANAARVLFRSPTARPLLHAMPRIARSTVAQLARRVGAGRVVNPRIALRTLAKNTYRTLSRPRALVNAYRRSLRGDRRYHRRTVSLVGRTPSRMIRRRPQAYRVGSPGYRYNGYAGPAMPGVQPGYAPGVPMTYGSSGGATPTAHIPAVGVPPGYGPAGVAPTSVCYCYPLAPR